MIYIVLVLFVFAIMLAFYMQKKESFRREKEQDRRQERFERLMDVLKKQNSDKKNEVSDTTEGEKKYKS
jgi:uncharacterized membrane protein